MSPTDPPAADGPGPVEDRLRGNCHGLPPLSARLEPWMRELLAEPEACSELLETYGSPVNVHEFSALARNARELQEAAAAVDVDLGVFVARKANKTLGLVAAAQEAGLGLDVGSRRELEQVLDLGVAPERVVVTSAIKPRPLLERALRSGSTLVLDGLDEVAAVDALVASSDAPHPVAVRLAPAPGEHVAPTRFGESAATWRSWAAAREAGGPLRIDGVHFHLHGYAPEARAAALREALSLIDALRELGHRPSFIDIGGGIPMSYLEDQEQWAAFWGSHDHLGERPGGSLLWRDQPLREVYPYHQQLVRGPWLGRLLRSEVTPGTSIAAALRSRGLELRCEPGRSVLDGCGVTLARVIQRSSTSDRVPLVGLEMNRTQCRSTSDDFLVDPVLVRTGEDPSGPLDGFLVGAYCIEAELIQRRRLRFPHGVAVGDTVALPNTAGYLMHILESASHQIPLASNVVRAGSATWRDRIDAHSPLRPWAAPEGG